MPRNTQRSNGGNPGNNNRTKGNTSPGFNPNDNWGAPLISGGTIIALNPKNDSIVDTQKVTAGYFTGGGGTLNAADIYSASLADSNEAYYFNIAQTHPDSSSAETQFSVAYGHTGGSGSDTDSGDIEGASKAIYGQWASALLDESEVSGGFIISSPASGGAVASGKDHDIYVLVGKRTRFKDRINKKNWTIALSGSNDAGTGSDILHLTDDSDSVTATATVGGPRYNIVSGSQGSVHTAATTRTFGWFYPDMGVAVLSAAELSASIGGVTPTAGAVEFDNSADKGFAINGANDTDEKNALRFINCLQPTGAYLKFRSEEDQVSVSWFCRARANDFNFSNNPTFVSGSYNEIKNSDMWGNPNSYITGVGLYSSGVQLVAIGKLSTPLKKNFSSEATIKVKLTY